MSQQQAAKINPFALSFSEVKTNVIRVMKAYRTANILGPPGAGKSKLVRAIEKQLDLFVIDLRLSTCEPPDLMGFASINEKTQKGCYLPMENFPLEGELPPFKPGSTTERYKGWILFLDEWNQADPAVMKAAFGLMLDRTVGGKPLHKNCFVVAAGNYEEDSSVVEDVPLPLKSRMITFHLRIDHEEWLNWASKAGIDHRVVAYVQARPQHLFTMRKDVDDWTYACPRTYEALSDTIKGTKDFDHVWKSLIVGTIGTGVGSEFYQFSKIYKDLLTLDQILADPKGVDIPHKPDVIIALANSMGEYATDANMGDLMTFIRRLGGEYQISAMRSIVGTKPQLEFHPEASKWAVEVSKFAA